MLGECGLVRMGVLYELVHNPCQLSTNKEAWVNEMWCQDEQRGCCIPTFMRVSSDWEVDVVDDLFVKPRKVKANQMEMDMWKLRNDRRFISRFQVECQHHLYGNHGYPLESDLLCVVGSMGKDTP